MTIARGVLATIAPFFLAGCRPADEAPAARAAPPEIRNVPKTRDYVARPILIAQEQTDAPARRIVSTSPQLTEIACALGLLKRLAGRSTYCDHPPGIEEVPSVGNLRNLNLEQVLLLEPDLVLISGRSEMIRSRLEGARIAYVSLPDSSLEDIFQAIEKLGGLTDRRKTAAALVDAIRDDLGRLAAEYTPRRSRAVLMLTGMGMGNPPRAPWVAGPGSYLDTLLTMAGHTNAAAGMERPYAQMPLEEILTRDPEVILEFTSEQAAGPEQYRRAYEAWARVGPLQAVAKRRIRIIPGQMHLVPGPRVALTLREIIRSIPE